MVGLWPAAHAPERIERLAMCCTFAHPGNPEAWSERAATVLDAGGTVPIADTVVARWVTRAFAAEAIPGARFELLEPTAHIPMAERPDAVAGLILEHLEVAA